MVWRLAEGCRRLDVVNRAQIHWVVSAQFILVEWMAKKTLRAVVCKNQTNSKFRAKGEKFDFFHILILDRLDYNKKNHWLLFLAKYLFISEKNTNNKIPLKSSFLAANYCTSLRASHSKTNHNLVFSTLKSFSFNLIKPHITIFLNTAFLFACKIISFRKHTFLYTKSTLRVKLIFSMC